MAAVTSAVVGVAGLALAAKGQADARKAANQATDAAKNAGVNIPQVTQQAHDQAIQNAYDSAALERQLNPLAPQLRNQSLQAVIDQLKANPDSKSIQQSLLQQFNAAPTGAPAFTDYSQSQLSQQAQAKALADLQLGGKLDQETANQVTRSSAAHAGGFGGGLGLGRDLSARDLGLTSLGLAQQRLATAGAFGSAQDQFNAQHAGAQNAYGLNAAQLALQQQSQRQGLGMGLLSFGQQGFQNALQAAQFGQSIAQPVTGLDPSAIANLAVGNSNQQGAAAQNAAALRGQAANGLTGLGGQLTGFGLSSLANMSKPQYGQTGVNTYGTIGYHPPASNYAQQAGMFGLGG